MRVEAVARVSPQMKERLQHTCNMLGLTEAEYIRGALAAKLRADLREMGSDLKAFIASQKETHLDDLSMQSITETNGAN